MYQIAILSLLFSGTSAFSVAGLSRAQGRIEECPSLLKAASTNDNMFAAIQSIDESNGEMNAILHRLRQFPYFRLYSVDILASCEYMPQELFECYSETCEIYPIDDEEVPDKIRDIDHDEHEFDIDGWARWDMPSNDYYDTEEFPEDYTGYDGSEVWNFIHNRICFSDYGYEDDHWKSDFNKAVSGLHSVISAQVIQGIQDKIDREEEFGDDEVWQDPEVEFVRRLSPEGETPNAMDNLYFAYMLALSAAAKAKDRLLEDCEKGRIHADAVDDLKALLALPILHNADVDSAADKLREHAVMDPDSNSALWEARMRTRELLRIINCVQCNKCRLHGKISMMGLSTVLQIHLGRTGEGGDVTRVHRVELATLVSTLHKFSRAIELCAKMKKTA